MANRNSEAHFELAPQAEIERSTFDRSCDIKTSFNVGELIPFYVDEVLPGDTFQIETSKVARLQTLITPVMDNLYLDTYYFFVPNRLVWEHWQEFCGENKTSSWYEAVERSIPKIYFPENGWNVGTIADYMGIPVNVVPDNEEIAINALPFRAYALIFNEWFRDENLQDPLVVPVNDADRAGSNGDGLSDVALGGKPAIANKYHDYFTSCLPSPQKGPDVSFLDGMVPVKTYYEKLVTQSYTPMFMNQTGATDKNMSGFLAADYNTNGRIYYGDEPSAYTSSMPLGYPTNLYVDLSEAKTKYDYGTMTDWYPLSINSLRQAFQIQRLFEKDARGGTRYIEILKSHFGVTSPDARLQRPEYLGGNRVPFDIQQVLQTSSTDATTPQGNVSGWSQTNDSNYDVEKSFVEHGYIIGLMCARYDHSYQQGIEPMWTRDTRFDFYWPALAHLGEKAVYTREIYCQGELENWHDVFGYQEAWAEYRYKPNYITGQMRSKANGSLDIWHFGDNYNSAPSLSAEWIQEDKSNVDRALAVQSGVANQIFIDIYVRNKCTRAMPLYSIPGLIDHF